MISRCSGIPSSNFFCRKRHPCWSLHIPGISGMRSSNRLPAKRLSGTDPSIPFRWKMGSPAELTFAIHIPTLVFRTVNTPVHATTNTTAVRMSTNSEPVAAMLTVSAGATASIIRAIKSASKSVIHATTTGVPKVHTILQRASGSHREMVSQPPQHDAPDALGRPPPAEDCIGQGYRTGKRRSFLNHPQHSIASQKVQAFRRG